MTTGEKLALLREQKDITQEKLSEILNVSRQSVSRWETNISFPETEKLIKLSKLFECSIDFLLNEDIQGNEENSIDVSIDNCYKFIRECGYFFLATSFKNQPKLRPFGMIYSNKKALYFATDKRKNVYSDLIGNPQIELASYNVNTRKWIRVNGKAEVENSIMIKDEMMNKYPLLKQKFFDKTEMFLVIFKLNIDEISIY
ncbi:helix-turn-helix domain-containing protein [bacterium D16-51]|nr:helix-turn-helix domain-containing protein [bacterium D16-59]RKI57892.1 helix-turn-helix domain-containing protein [bacterium D16-51]